MTFFLPPFFVSVLSALWAILGLWKPAIVLWWAVPEKQTKGRALSFAATLSGAFCLCALLFLPDTPNWLWLPSFVCLLSLVPMAGSFRMTKKQEEEMTAERERAKKAQICHTVYSTNSDREYEISPYLMTCTCPDWEKRRSDSYGPFAVCKHLATHYWIHKDELPDDLEPYRDMITFFALEDKGLPYQGKIFDYGVIEGMAYIFTGYADSLPWVNVYIDPSATKRYGFNIETKKWAKGEEPPCAEEIASTIQRRQG